MPPPDSPGYDNLAQAMLSTFVSVTLEGWVDVMYLYQDTNNWWVSTIYHIFLVLLCAFFCANLALAVIAGEFEKQAEASDAEEAAEEAKKMSANEDAITMAEVLRIMGEESEEEEEKGEVDWRIAESGPPPKNW